MKTNLFNSIVSKGVQVCVIVLISLLNSANVAAQDTLKFRNGNLLFGKVMEITPTVVKYKKVENIDGPTYSDLKNDLEYVKFQNGQTEVFEIQAPVAIVTPNPNEAPAIDAKKYPSIVKVNGKYSYGGYIVGNRDMHNILLSLNDKKISRHIRDARQQKAWQYIGFGAIPLGIAAITILDQPYTSSSSKNEQIFNSGIVAALGVVCITTSITMKVKRNQNEAAALRLYQMNY